jgi:hypothetical protein
VAPAAHAVERRLTMVNKLKTSLVIDRGQLNMTIIQLQKPVPLLSAIARIS